MSFAFWTLHHVSRLFHESALLNRPIAIFINEDASLRRVPKPTAVPNPMGRRIEAAGFRNTADGSVMAGMYVVIFGLRGLLRLEVGRNNV